MTDLYVKELEGKVARYQAIMSKCPQCKTNLPTQEAESTTPSSRPSGPSCAAQQPGAKVPPPAPTGPPKRPAPPSTVSSSARSSKQLHPTSGPELQASNSQQYTRSIPSAASSSQTHQVAEAPVSTLRNQARNSSTQPTTASVTSSAADSSARPTTSSQNTSTQPPSLPLKTSAGRQQYSGELVSLDLQHYKKPKSWNQGGRPPGESPRHAEWMRSAEIMLEEVPSGRQWREKVLGLDSSITAAVVMSVAPVPEGDVSLTEDVERKELIRIVRRFAEQHSEVRLNFEHFILVCLCKVLSSQGVPQGKIVETLQICISDTGKRNIQRYLKGATWVNEMMNDLFFTDWVYRAVDLIVIWNRPISTYAKMSSATDSRQYFLTDLTHRKYFEGYREVPDRRHDTIPWIVKKELGDEVSYRDICEALGYSDGFFMKTKHLHSSNPPSPDLNAGDSDDAGSTSRTGSFHTAEQSTTSASNFPSPDLSAGDSDDAGSTSAEETPSTYRSNASYVQDLSQLRRRALQGASPNDAAGRDPLIIRNAASQRSNRIVPDRSAKPLGDPDVVDQRRRKRHEIPSSVKLPSTSLGESVLSTHRTKRPLPDSPTSASGPIDTTRRRQNVRERSSREEMGPSSHSGKKGSNDRRRRA